MKLHFNPASPFVRMVNITAHELGLSDQMELAGTGMLSPVSEHEAVLADNPLGKIPALVTDHGACLHDSRVICEYLVHHGGDLSLLPHEPVKRFRILTLQALCVGMMDGAVSLRYEIAMRPAELQWQEWKDRQMQRIETGLTSLADDYLEDLNGDVTLGNIAAATILGYLEFRLPDHPWRQNHPPLADFYDTFSQRPSMQNTQHANPV